MELRFSSFFFCCTAWGFDQRSRLPAARLHCILCRTPACINARRQNTLTRARTHFRGHLDKMRVCRVTITHGLNLLLPRGRQHYQLRVKDKGREGVGEKERAKKDEGDAAQCNNGRQKKTPSTGKVPAKWNTHIRVFKNNK